VELLKKLLHEIESMVISERGLSDVC
jgi:hypothetical protein